MDGCFGTLISRRGFEAKDNSAQNVKSLRGQTSGCNSLQEM